MGGGRQPWRLKGRVRWKESLPSVNEFCLPTRMKRESRLLGYSGDPQNYSREEGNRRRDADISHRNLSAVAGKRASDSACQSADRIAVLRPVMDPTTRPPLHHH